MDADLPALLARLDSDPQGFAALLAEHAPMTTHAVGAPVWARAIEAAREWDYGHPQCVGDPLNEPAEALLVQQVLRQETLGVGQDLADGRVFVFCGKLDVVEHGELMRRLMQHHGVSPYYLARDRGGSVVRVGFYHRIPVHQAPGRGCGIRVGNDVLLETYDGGEPYTVVRLRD